MGSPTAKEIGDLCQLKADRKLLQHHYSEKTGKPLLMRDIHNIASKAKQMNATLPSENGAVSDLSSWMKEEYPYLKTEFVLSESNVMTGLFFQDKEMMSTFSMYPQLLLCDATHKTKVNGMPFYALLVVDGEGESQVAAAFFVEHEDEQSIRKMVQIFKAWNPQWQDIEVVITDKDMVE